MKKYIFILALSLSFVNQLVALDNSKDSNQLFYKANAYYESGNYVKAIETYTKILDRGLESGNTYYNIGNGFLKLGKVGYAILCYEKAEKFTPGDSDLKSNLSYAQSLIEGSSPQASSKNFIIRAIERPFKDFNLNTIAIFALVFYLLVILISSVLIVNLNFAKKARLAFIAILTIFFLNLAVFFLRYYDEEIIDRGIVIQKEVECRYEPIDKATTYYKLYEGNEVIILETKDNWRRIRRLDGKIAWLKREAVEEI